MSQNIRLHKLLATGLVVLAALALTPHAHAQSDLSLDALETEVITALKARDRARAITLLQQRLHLLIEAHGEQAPQATAARKDLTDAQDNYADALYREGKYAEALALYQIVLAQREHRSGSVSTDAATSLNDVAKTLARLGRYGEALPLSQRALAIAEKLQGPEHATTAMRLDTLARLYGLLGQYARAEPLLLRAVAISEKALGPENPDTGTMLNNLAGLYYSMGEYAKAEQLYLRVLAIDEKTLGPEHPDLSTGLNNLAALYELMGQYARAEPLYVRALALDEKALGPQHPDISIGLNNLAGLYRIMGLYARAEPLYLRALTILENTLGPVHPSTGITLNNLAALYELMGQYAKAEPLNTRALAIAEKALGHEHPTTGIRLSNLAGLYRTLGLYNRAELLYVRALAIAEHALGSDHPSTGTTLNNLAGLYQSMGQYARAEPLYVRALAIAEKTLGPDHPETGTSLNNLAGLYKTMDLYAKAEPLYARALAIAEKTLGPEHPKTGASLNNLAVLYRSMNRSAEALPLYQRALLIAHNAGSPELLWNIQSNLRAAHASEKQPDLAIFFGKQAVNTLQGMRSNLSQLDRDLQRGFLNNKTHAYRDLADLLIQQGRLAEAQHVLGMLKEEEFFDFVRRSEADDPRLRRIAFQPQEQPWHDRLSALTARTDKAAAERADLERRARLGLNEGEIDRLAALNREKVTLGAELQRYYRDVAAAFTTAKGQGNEAPDAVTQLRATQQTLSSLGAGTVLVQYVLSENRLNIIFTTASIQLARQIEIKSADLNQKIELFRAALQEPAISAQPMAQEFYTLLIAPIEQELHAANARTLMLSLDGALRYIPVAALHDGKQYLVEKFDLSLYTEVARDNLRHRPGTDISIAGLGVTRQIDEFSSLPAVRAELNAIVRNGNRGLIKGELHFDEQFNLASLKQALQNKHPLIHLASHFVFRPGNESTSFLLLGDGDRLTLSRIREEKLDFSHVELVTLSACETGVGGGRTAQGEEIEGLGSLVQKQGARSVIATLWPVDDVSTGLLMQNFYRLHEEKNLSKADALRQAQLMLITGQPSSAAGSTQPGLDAVTAATPKPAALYAHPYFWAPFILMGNWL